MPSKKNLSKFIFQGVLIAGIFITGFDVGKFVNNIPYFKIDEKISLVELLSIATTLFAAWYIAKVIDKEKTDNRNEKDLILKRLDGIFQIIEDSNLKVSTGVIPYQEATSFIKRINDSLTNVCTILKSTTLIINEELKENILQNTRKLRDLLTDTPMSKINASPTQSTIIALEVKDGIIYYQAGRLSEIEIEYDKLKYNFLLFQLAINKA